MKKLLIALIFSTTSAFAQYQVTVDNTGKLQYPTAENFTVANFSLKFFIDTTPSVNIQTPNTQRQIAIGLVKPYYVNASGTRTATTNASGGTLSTTAYYYTYTPNICYWSDCEVKAIRKSDGELVYWVSTQQGATSTDYLTHSARDVGAKIFFTASRTDNDGRNWHERKDTDYTSNYQYAMLQTGGFLSSIGGIVIEPDLTNARVAEIFKNPQDYDFIFIKIDPTNGVEKDTNGNPVWRPIAPTIGIKN